MSSKTLLKAYREEDLQKKVALIVGTRPGIVMFSPVIRACRKYKLDYFVIHAGQHYSANMDEYFFRDLKLGCPEYKLNEVKRYKSHGSQTARMIEGIEKVLIKERPSITIVGGDANCNLAGALAARKLHIKVGHIEAGERSYDWRMPEEHNRVIIDHISDLLFTTNSKGKDNLIDDDVRGKIYVTGNTIVDAAYQNLKIASRKSRIFSELGLTKRDYFLMTIHREENVDSVDTLRNILCGVELIAKSIDVKILFPVHPRTKRRIKEFRLNGKLKKIKNCVLLPPIGYLDFIDLLFNSKLVMTDSGGVQQEACILGIPCITFRKNTEWTETLKIGANALCGSDPEDIVESALRMYSSKKKWKNPFGDGKSAEKIALIIKDELKK